MRKPFKINQISAYLHRVKLFEFLKIRKIKYEKLLRFLNSTINIMYVILL